MISGVRLERNGSRMMMMMKMMKEKNMMMMMAMTPVSRLNLI